MNLGRYIGTCIWMWPGIYNGRVFLLRPGMAVEHNRITGRGTLVRNPYRPYGTNAIFESKWIARRQEDMCLEYKISETVIDFLCIMETAAAVAALDYVKSRRFRKVVRVLLPREWGRFRKRKFQSVLTANSLYYCRYFLYQRNYGHIGHCLFLVYLKTIITYGVP